MTPAERALLRQDEVEMLERKEKERGSTPKEFVISVYPAASCHGPVKIFWPGQGERIKYIVTKSPIHSQSLGEGDDEEEAWYTAGLTTLRSEYELANKNIGELLSRLAAARAGEGEATRFEVLRHVCLACGHEIDTTMCSYPCEFDASSLGERPAESWTRRVYAVTETLLREGKDVRAESLQPVVESETK